MARNTMTRVTRNSGPRNGVDRKTRFLAERKIVAYFMATFRVSSGRSEKNHKIYFQTAIEAKTSHES
jgi:hypothetical protein